MRKVLFVHDGPRWKDSKGNQYGSKADLDMYARYMYLGDQVEFAMRVFKTDDTSKLINLNENGLHVKEIAPFNRPALLKNYFKSKQEIIRQVEEADVIVVRLPSTIGSVAVAHAKKIKKPYLVEVVVCPWDTLRNHGSLGKLYAPFSRNKLRKLVADAPYVIYVTKKFLQGRYPTKYGGVGISDVVLTNLPVQNNKEARYADFDIKKPITFTSLGAVNLPHKGHHYVIEAMATLVKEGYDVHYNIVGGGDTARLTNIAQQFGVADRVNFPGKIPHEEIFSILENTDLYLQPSDAEGLPRALIEAMSVGCACVGSDVAGIPELLDDSAVFKKGNVNDLKDKIKKVLNRDVLVSHSKRNFELAKEYEFNALEVKRREYYDKFLQSINEK